MPESAIESQLTNHCYWFNLLWI